jgi:hypothetical protein
LKKIEMLSVQSVEHSVSTITYKLQTMSGNTATATTAIAPAANPSVVVQRLCEMFGKNYDEVSAAIQTEMTAMEHELQCWKLQMSDRAATTTTAEIKTKKAPAKPRAKKPEAATESIADAAAAAESVAPPPAADADATKTKKAPRAKKVAAEKPAAVVDSVPAESNDVVVAEPAASSASEPKAKKAPRAKKVAATADSGSESDASVAPAPAAAATPVEPKAKKTAAPRAKKADKSAVASAAAADTVAADEQKAKKAPRAKKVAAADKPVEVVAQQVDEVADTNVDDDAESVFEEIEIEVVEFTFDGVKYLRSKNDDNTVYDPETSDVIGKWNEETGCIDAE